MLTLIFFAKLIFLCRNEIKLNPNTHLKSHEKSRGKFTIASKLSSDVSDVCSRCCWLASGALGAVFISFALWTEPKQFVKSSTRINIAISRRGIHRRGCFAAPADVSSQITQQSQSSAHNLSGYFYTIYWDEKRCHFFISCHRWTRADTDGFHSILIF